MLATNHIDGIKETTVGIRRPSESRHRRPYVWPNSAASVTVKSNVVAIPSTTCTQSVTSLSLPGKFSLIYNDIWNVLFINHFMKVNAQFTKKLRSN